MCGKNIYDLIDEKIKGKYGVKNINEITKPQIRKYKIDRARLFKGSEHPMYVHEDITISSNVNEVIRAVLNSLYFFCKKIFHAPKVPKAPKAPKAQKQKDTTEQKLKTLSANKIKKWIKKHLRRKKVTYSLICVFVLFVCAKKRDWKK